MFSKEELVILELLKAKGATGPAGLVRISGGRLKLATVYPVLSDLAQRGFVKTREEKAKRSVALPLPVYEITLAGNHAYEQAKRSA